MEMTAREIELNARLEKMERTLEAVVAENERLSRENQRLLIENKLLREKADKLVRRIFGSSSEKIDPAQLQLLLEFAKESEPGKSDASPCSGPAADTWEAPPEKDSRQRPARNRKPRIPEHLPVEEQTIVPEEVLREPEQWRRIGEEVSEQLDYEPGRFFRRRTVRLKFVRIDDIEHPPVIAPLPPSLQDACLVAPGLIAAVVVNILLCVRISEFRTIGSSLSLMFSGNACYRC